MTDNAPAEILTEETVPAYLAERADDIGNIFPKDATLKAIAIQGGNVNYAFRITCEESGQTCFVKQAPEFVAIFGPDGYPLSSERMQKEIDVFDEWRAVLGTELSKKYLPDIYLFDKRRMTFVMEFLEGFDLLDHVLVKDGTFHPAVAEGLGDFMGRTHSATHSSKNTPDRVKYLTEHFENRPMRDVQLEFVFTKAYKEATDEQRVGLDMNEDFLKEVAELKALYDGKGDPSNLVLSHGDIHPGSIMVNDKGGVKVIDPEFTVYGPPGLDVGSLLSGFVLAAIQQGYAKNPSAVQTLCEGAESVWKAYAKAMADGGIDGEYINTIEDETVGFTVAEVCRTALEFAGGRVWFSFEDKKVNKAAKKAALEIVSACMIKRHEGGAIKLLMDEIKKMNCLKK